MINSQERKLRGLAVARSGVRRAPALSLFSSLASVLALVLGLTLYPGLVAAGPVAIPGSGGAIEGGEGTFNVPPVIERPFSEDEGERLQVRRFELLNMVTDPNRGISQEEIQSLLRDFQAKYPEGLTISRLQQSADLISRYYRERGYILAQAILPVQTVEDGVVRIELLEGRLGRILVEGNRIYSKDLLRDEFAPLLGRAVRHGEVEERLITLSGLPGLTVFGVFRPGEEVANADLLLKVQREKRFDVAYRIDNEGTQSIGRNRARVDVSWNNPTGAGDMLRLAGQQSYTPKNQVYWQAYYNRYLGRGFSANVRYERNRFDVGGEFREDELRGNTRNYALGFRKSLIRSRQKNLFVGLSFENRASVSTRGGDVTSADRLSLLAARLDFDRVDTRFGGLDFLSLEYRRGFNDLLGAGGDSAEAESRRSNLPITSRSGRKNGSQVYAAGQFHKLTMNYTRLQTITANQSVLFRGELQWSPDLLMPLEQYSGGGPDNVRGHAVAERLWDNAAFFSAEYLVNAPFIADRNAYGNHKWGELIQVSAFFDQAAGEINLPGDTDPEGFTNIRSVGLGLRVNLPSVLESRVFMSWELSSRSKAGNDRRPQLWADLIYRF